MTTTTRQPIMRRPRSHNGAKITVFLHPSNGKWRVRYVTDVDQHGEVWSWPDREASRDFDSWRDAMDHALAQCPMYGDQQRRRYPRAA